ncbi:MAG: pilus assembly protein N-terminal domain-containing protein [Eubacterium sp.]|nr:pilus assembly protein N-terminal domain-containing protein [Eubacterium sp.]
MKNKKNIALLLVVISIFSLGFSVDAAELKKNTYAVTCGQKITINVETLFGDNNDYVTAQVEKSKIASVKVSGNKLIITGKKVGSTKIVINNAGDKCIERRQIMCYVSPTGFSLEAPYVSVQTSVYVNNKHVHQVSWSKVKGATGYKIYRAVRTKSGIKKVLVKKVLGSKDTVVYVPVKKYSESFYYVQAYKKYKGKVYYGVYGYNTESME